MNKKNDIFHSKNYLILNFLILLGYIFYYKIITNKLNPEIFGSYILAYSIATIIVSISNLGVTEAYKRNFFEFYKKKKETEILLFTVQIFMSFIFSIILLMNIFFQKKIMIYFEELNYIEFFWPLLIFAIMLESISQIYLIYLENNKFSQTYFFISFFKYLFFFIFVFYFFFKGYDVASLIYGLLYSNLILIFLIFIYQIKNNYFIFKFKYLKSIITIALPTTPKILFGKVNSKIDKIIIGIFVNKENVAVFSIAQTLSYVIFQITTSIGKVFVTQTNRMLFEKKNEKIGEYLIFYIYFCSLPAIGLILFNNLILKIFINNRYHGSENVIVILSIYYFSLIFGKVSGTQLMYAKKVWLITNFFIFNIILNIIFNIPLIYFYGIVGAAVATLSASLISLFFYFYYANKFAPVYYDVKKVCQIYAFIFATSVYSILINESILKINKFQNFLIALLILALYLFFGLKYKFYKKKDINNVLKLK